jgi:hypothetical protein
MSGRSAAQGEPQKLLTSGGPPLNAPTAQPPSDALPGQDTAGQLRQLLGIFN